MACKMNLQKSWPVLSWAGFCLAIIAAYLFYQPSWGVMDDWGYRNLSLRMWQSAHPFQMFLDELKNDFISQKMRPIYIVYSMIFYKVFAHHPTLFYIVHFLLLMSFFPLWGLIFYKIFNSQEEIQRETVYFYPLSFFIFTPFWNNFMYLSLQEKFLFIFGGASIYCFVMARISKTAQLKNYIFTGIFAFLALMSKPTGIFLLVVYMGYSALSLSFNPEKSKKDWFWGSACLLTAVIYFFVVKLIVQPGGYSRRYVDNLTPMKILGQLFVSSIFIKALVVLAIVFLVVYIVLARKKKISFLSVLMPVGLLSYLLILAPWGLINYFLSPATPFIFGMLFPVYGWIKNQLRSYKLTWIPPAVLFVMIIFVVGQVIFPRIHYLADIKNAELKIAEIHRSHSGITFYFPPPFMETHKTLQEITGADIGYFPEGVLRGEALGLGENYLIFNSQCRAIELSDVEVGPIIYQNKTWRIYSILKKENVNSNFNVKFPRTFLQRLIDKTRT